MLLSPSNETKYGVDGLDYVSMFTPQSEKGPVTMYPSRYNGFGALEALSLSVLDP